MLAPKPRIRGLARPLEDDDPYEPGYRPLGEALVLGVVIAVAPELVRAYREHKARQWAEANPELCSSYDPQKATADPEGQ